MTPQPSKDMLGSNALQNSVQICKILEGERTALNILAHASGIATLCKQYDTIVKEHGWHGKVAATRKTTPGFYLVQKYAVLVGGCDTHRMDLSEMVMLKDNAITGVGSVARAVSLARSVAGFSHKIEVEARTLSEAEQACDAGADVVMLDNFQPNEAKSVAELLKRKRSDVVIEVSGGVTIQTLPSFFNEFIDVVSTSKLIQGAPHVDFSLKILHKS